MRKSIFVLKAVFTILFMSKGLAQTSADIEASQRKIQEVLSGRSSIIVASRKTEGEAVKFVNSFYRRNGLSDADVSFTIFLAENGWFGLSIGDTPTDQCDQTVRNLVSQGLIPDDSFCTNAQTYIAAFDVRNNALNPLIGRNYFSDGVTKNVSAPSASGAAPLNFDIFFKNINRFEIYEKLDGSLFVGSARENLEHSVCIYANEDSNESIRSAFSSIVLKSVDEFFEESGFDMKGSSLTYSGVCDVKQQNGRISLSRDAGDIAVIHRASLQVMNAAEWTRVGEISDRRIRKVASSQQKAAQKADEKRKALQDEYEKLAREGSQLKIGSVNLAYPGSREKANICTKSIIGDAAIPYTRYLRYRNGRAFTDGFIDAAAKSYSGSNFFNDGYSQVYKDLDDLFVNWQRSNGANCDVWVDYPAEIVKFLEAAIRVDPDLAYEFNDLVPVDELYDFAAKEQGFNDWDELQFGKAIAANSAQVRQLREFEISTTQSWKALVDEIRQSGYSSSVYPNIALQYLQDRKTGQSLEKTALDIRNDRQKREAAERKRREEERAEYIRKGEGTFVYYDDNSCTEGKDSYCLTKEEFNGMCEKVGSRTSSGFVSIYSTALLYQQQNLKDLYRSNRSSVSGPSTYVAKNDNCYFKFNVAGSVRGTDINKNVYCHVTRIKGRSGKFYTSGILDCFAR